jgi:hypothetical protein
VDREFVRQRIRDEEREMAAALGIRTSQRTERRQRRDFYIISRCITANMVWAVGYASAYLAYPVDPPMPTISYRACQQRACLDVRHLCCQLY